MLCNHHHSVVSDPFNLSAPAPNKSFIHISVSSPDPEHTLILFFFISSYILGVPNQRL